MRYFLLFFLLFSLSFSSFARVTNVRVRRQDNSFLNNRFARITDNQDVIIDQLDQLIFLAQTACVTLGFIWGCNSVKLYIMAKNQRSLL